MRVRLKGKIVDAHQWWRNGDHPEDNCHIFRGPDDGLDFWGEGHVVRYYRDPHQPNAEECKVCGFQMHLHGWLDLLIRVRKDKEVAICPGDWIVKIGNRYTSYRNGMFTEVDNLDKRIT